MPIKKATSLKCILYVLPISRSESEFKTKKKKHIKSIQKQYYIFFIILNLIILKNYHLKSVFILISNKYQSLKNSDFIKMAKSILCKIFKFKKRTQNSRIK